MKSIDPATLGSRAFYQYMTAAVAPRPIALASTVDQDGHVNLSPFSFFNYVGIDPPIVVFSPGRRGCDGSYKDTALNIMEVPELVVNMVTFDMVQQMSLSSAEYGRGVNEFEKAGFTMLPSERIKPPRLAESPAQFECRVLEIKEIGTMVLVIAEVVLAHFAESILDENGKIDQIRTDWVARMGGDWYARASGEAIFEVPRPQPGIGVDSLPESIRHSKILTGNDLGQLGGLTEFPTLAQIVDFSKTEKMQSLREEAKSGCRYFPDLLHNHAQHLMLEGNIAEALLTLLQQEVP